MRIKPEEISSEILKVIKKSADTYLQNEYERKCVVTVPAHFDA